MKIDQSIKDKAVSEYLEGRTQREVSEKYGFDPATLYHELNRLGIARRGYTGSRRTYTLNESFFDYVDTEEKAYWLGFITADGNISETCLTVSLQSKDITHLEKMAESLGSNRHITHLKSGAVSIQFHSSQLVQSLDHLGIRPHKSHTVEPCPYVPKKLEHHYWRGVFDGDGCISKTAKTWALSLVGSLPVVTGFKEFIRISTGLNPKINPMSSIYHVGYGSVTSVRDICDVIYMGNAISLDRKKELYELLCTYPTQKRRRVIPSGN